MVQINQKVLSLLGLACAAGKAASGNTAVEEALRSFRVKALFLQSDCSENTVKQYCAKAASGKVPFYLVEGKELGSSVGHPERKVVAVLDTGFAKAIEKEICLLNNFGGVGQ